MRRSIRKPKGRSLGSNLLQCRMCLHSTLFIPLIGEEILMFSPNINLDLLPSNNNKDQESNPKKTVMRVTNMGSTCRNSPKYLVLRITTSEITKMYLKNGIRQLATQVYCMVRRRGAQRCSKNRNHHPKNNISTTKVAPTLSQPKII